MEKLERVQKLLSNYGFCSRRKAEELIMDGKVRVNNKTISIGDKASEKDKIYVANKLVEKNEKIYIMFHKPLNCVTALNDPQYRTVMHYIDIDERVFPVGRLDYNTSGLLLLTNDGDFANNVMHPRYEIKKTYLAKTDRPITKEQIMRIQEGVILDGRKTGPSKIKIHNKDLLEITIHEGRNRVIRRMLKSVGLKTKELKRMRIGNLGLGGLKREKYKLLTKKDIDKIFS